MEGGKYSVEKREKIEEMYFILVVFIEMILLSGWAIKEEDN